MRGWNKSRLNFIHIPVCTTWIFYFMHALHI
jgi:hypothetical protein